MTEKEKIIRDISLTFIVHEDVIEDVIGSQFSFIHDTIKGGDRTNPDTLKNIQVTHLGKFAVKESKKKFYNKLKEERENGGDTTGE